MCAENAEPGQAEAQNAKRADFETSACKSLLTKAEGSVTIVRHLGGILCSAVA